jgi:hypothetical protein
MIITAIDPGTEISALVQYDATRKIPLHRFTATNNEVMAYLYTESRGNVDSNILIIEEFESFGMAVGREAFRTVWWSGRMYEVWNGPKIMLPRRTVKVHLCGTSRATDSNVRTAIIDAFGGKLKAQGKKNSQGPLYGIKGHEFSALALALTHAGHFGV